MLFTVDAPLTKKFINFLMVDGKKNLAYKIFSVASYEFLRSLANSKKTKAAATSPKASNTFLRPSRQKPLQGLLGQSSKDPGLSSGCLAGAKGTSASLIAQVDPQNSMERAFPTPGKAQNKVVQQGGNFYGSKGLTMDRKNERTPSLVKPIFPGGGESVLLVNLAIAVENVKPSLECRKCRVAGTSILFPSLVPEKRGRTLAGRLIIEAARERKKRNKISLSHCLAQELLDAYEKQGRPRQRREQYHKLAEGNRGYLRYRWW